MISDNGAEFLSPTFRDFAKLYDIELYTTTAKNSTGNSPVERFHSTLTELIRIIYRQNNKKPITEIVDEAIISYNNSIHSTTKLTPFELITGHYTMSNPLSIKSNVITAQDYIKQHKEDYEQLANLTHQRSLEIKQKIINRLNEKRKDAPNFETGERIFESDNRRNKLDPKFVEHKVVRDNKVTILTQKRKVHKQKLKRKRKFSGQPGTPRQGN